MQRRYIAVCLVALLCAESCDGFVARFTGIARRGLSGKLIDPTAPRDAGGVR